jgi:hypothetical protein
LLAWKRKNTCRLEGSEANRSVPKLKFPVDVNLQWEEKSVLNFRMLKTWWWNFELSRKWEVVLFENDWTYFLK